MPRSRRSQLVALTQTSKKTRDHKASVVQDIRSAVDDHESIFLFSYENMRSNLFKKVRMDFREPDMEGKSSRIFLGKNKLMQIALGKTPEDEYADNLRAMSKHVTGSVGLLMTSKSREEVVRYFAELAEEDFARAGSIAPKQVVVTNEMMYNFPVSMVEQFRKLGMPIEVDTGKLVLIGNRKEYVVCKEGQELSVEACKILFQFGIKLSEFKVDLVCHWTNNGAITEF
jgi:mRNA turnover protein 4